MPGNWGYDHCAVSLDNSNHSYSIGRWTIVVGLNHRLHATLKTAINIFQNPDSGSF